MKRRKDISIFLLSCLFFGMLSIVSVRALVTSITLSTDLTAADTVFTIVPTTLDHATYTTATTSIAVKRVLGAEDSPVMGDLITFAADGSATVTLIDYVSPATNVSVSGDTATVTLSSAAVAARIVLHDDRNAFVESEYDLRKIMNESLHDALKQTFTLRADERAIYVLSDITLAHALTLNIPASIDFLGHVITGDVTIAHDVAGFFVLENTFAATDAVGISGTLTIATPVALYASAGIATTTTVLSSGTLSDSAVRSRVIAEATTYITSALPGFIAQDIILPRSYQTFPLYYDYAFSNGLLTSDGVIHPEVSADAVDVTVSLRLDDETVGTVTKTIHVASYDASLEKRLAVRASYLSFLLSAALQEAHDADGDSTFATQESPLDITSLLWKFNEECGSASGDDALVATLSGSVLSFAVNGSSSLTLTVDGTTPTSAFLVPTLLMKSATETLSIADAAATVTSVTTTFAYERSTDDEIGKWLESRVGLPVFMRATSGFNDVALLTTLSGVARHQDATSGTCVSTDVANDITIAYTINVLAEGSTTPTIDSTFTFSSASASPVVGGSTNPFFSLQEDTTTGLWSLVFASAAYAKETFTLAYTITVGSSAYEGTREIIISYSGYGGETPDYNNTNLGVIDGGVNSSSFSLELASIATTVILTSVTSTDTTVVLADAATITWGGTTFCLVDNHISGTSTLARTNVTLTQDAVPRADTTVKATVYLFENATSKASGIANAKTSREVSFTIPGLLILNRDVNDDALYAALLATCAQDTTREVLYTSEAEATRESFSFTGDGTTALDLTGIEYLSETASLSFSQFLSTSGLSSFTLLKTNALKSLTLSACGLTNATIGDALHGLVGLESADLSENPGITSIKGTSECLVYRTVKDLSLAGCALSTLTDGTVSVTDIASLTTLDVRGNQIKDFRVLTHADKLTSVTLANNVVSTTLDGVTLYGTAGAVNVPVYVALHDRGVTVNGTIVDGTPVPYTFALQATSTTEDFSTAIQEASWILNAVSYSYLQTATPSFPTAVHQFTSTGSTTYALTLVAHLQSGASVSTLAAGTFMRVVKISYQGLTVYAEYEMEVMS